MTAPFGVNEQALIRGRVVRFTLLDQCGAFIGTPTRTSFVTDGFITVKATKNMDNGTDINIRGANDVVQVFEPGRQSLLNMTIEVNLVKVNPAALVMLTSPGSPAIVDWEGTIAGWEEKSGVLLNQNFGMEVWTATSGFACVAGGVINGYMLYPLISQGWLEFDDITSKECTATLHGLTYGNPNWAKGPSDYKPVATDAIGTPGQLIANVDPNAHRHFELTPIAAPAPTPPGGPVVITP
jgi:hypothetical protein